MSFQDKQKRKRQEEWYDEGTDSLKRRKIEQESGLPSYDMDFGNILIR